jgi:hypothetical protein
MIEFHLPTGAGNFSLSHRVHTGTGVHTASYPRVLSLEVKRPGREADNLPPASAEIKNEWSYTSSLLIRLHGVVLN